MREKLREIRNKEEGFTLVELLAVIVILGIILAIAIPSIGNVVQKAKEDTENTEEVLIKDAARLYFTAEESAGESVSVGALIKAGYLDIRESKKYNDESTVQVKRSEKGVITIGEETPPIGNRDTK